MTSKLTREKAQWLHDACEEAAAAGIKLTMNPNELLMFTSYALAAMDGEPVAWLLSGGGTKNVVCFDSGNAYADPLREVTPLYRHAQPAPVVSGWIPVSERLPEEGGRYWCYVEEQNSLGKSHYQWNCSWNEGAWSDKALTGRVTHWMPLPAAPQEVKP